FVVGTDVLRPRLVGTEDSLGVRVPDHAALLQLLDAIGIPLAATSANRSGRPDVAEAADVAPGLLTVCAAAFAGGAAAAGEASPGEEGSGRGMTSTHGVASTVVDLRPLATGGSALVLREGAVPAAEALRRVEAAQAGRAPHAGSRSAPTG
ncbi:MAG TPA: Sua5/YciO/YrdC/YwlC family protein, partial [Thermoleophilia bacterium]|nr:Sua5/YciO/YrdC/YwlC family protein [Thermoleophilia bacterium]